MDSIILAAGYATRLFPLTLNQPKPLLKIGGKPIIEMIIERIDASHIMGNTYIVTNHRFKPLFDAWLVNYKSKRPIKIIDDMTLSDESRLGAIGDMNYVIEKEGLNEDLMIIAGDTLVDVDLENLVNLMYEKKGTVVVSKYMPLEKIKGRYGNVIHDENGFVVGFEEKPKNPQSNLASVPLYLLKRETIPEIKKFLKLYPNLDNLGEFLKYLIKEQNVFCFTTKGEYIDIGCIDDLNMADRKYGGKGEY
jgi:glucose-1-phosphate thymidylyltransferase